MRTSTKCIDKQTDIDKTDGILDDATADAAENPQARKPGGAPKPGALEENKT